MQLYECNLYITIAYIYIYYHIAYIYILSHSIYIYIYHPYIYIINICIHYPSLAILQSHLQKSNREVQALASASVERRSMTEGFPWGFLTSKSWKIRVKWMKTGGKTIVNQAFGNGNSMGMPAKIVTGGW